MPEKSGLRVMAFGTFDLLHPGHLYYLKAAKALGKELIVVVARDSTVLAQKGRKPEHNENERLKNVRKLEFVDKAVLGSESGGKVRYGVVAEFRPDVIALGYDQKPGNDEILEELGKLGLNPKIVRLPAFMEHKYKTSKLRGKQVG